MYRDLKASRAGWVRKKSYCNTVGCIARGGWFKEKFVLQRFKCIAIQWSAGVQNCIAIQFTGQQCIAIHYTVLWHETWLPVLQDRRLCRDTALGWGAGREVGRAGCAGRRRQCAGRAGGRCRRAQGAAWRGLAGARRAQAGARQQTRQTRGACEAWVLGARPRR